MLVTKSCLPESPLSSKYSIKDRDTESFTKVSRGVLSPGDEAPGTNIGPGNRKRNSSKNLNVYGLTCKPAGHPYETVGDTLCLA